MPLDEPEDTLGFRGRRWIVVVAKKPQTLRSVPVHQAPELLVGRDKGHIVMVTDDAMSPSACGGTRRPREVHRRTCPTVIR